MRLGKSATRFMAVMMLGALTASVPVKSASAVDVVDDPVQIDEMVGKVLTTTNSLCWDLYRYHQQQPGYSEAYKAAKEVWSKANQLRSDLAVGPVETELVVQQSREMSQIFANLEKSVAEWGNGDRSSLIGKTVVEQRAVVEPGVGVDVPFVGIRVGGPAVVAIDDAVVQTPRLRIHPNSRGSKRSLERELMAARMAIGYLVEDASISSPPNTNAASPTLAPTTLAPTTLAPTTDAAPTPRPN